MTKANSKPFRRADKINAAPVRWLVPGIVPLGHLSLIAGAPGVGKSHVAIDLAARVTRGAKIPGSDEKFVPGKALLVFLEDADSNIAVRLAASKARMKKISIFNGDSATATSSIQTFLAFIDGKLSVSTQTQLVVVDTLSAVCVSFGSKKNAMRDLIDGLTKLAKKYCVAVIGVTHFTKAKHASQVANVLGPVGVIASPRCIFHVTRDADPNRRLLLPVKNNLASDGLGLKFRLKADVEGTRTSTIVWTRGLIDAANVSVSPGFRQTALQKAVAVIGPRLVNRQSVASTELEAEAKRLGMSPTTVKKAAKELGFSVQRVGGIAGKGSWNMKRSTKRKLGDKNRRGKGRSRSARSKRVASNNTIALKKRSKASWF